MHATSYEDLRLWSVAWVVYLPSSSLAPFVCIVGALISSLGLSHGLARSKIQGFSPTAKTFYCKGANQWDILSLGMFQGSCHPRTCNTDPEILIQTLATRTKERIFCYWKMGYTRTIGAPLVSPTPEYNFGRVLL